MTTMRVARPRREGSRSKAPLWLLSPAAIVIFALTVVPIGFLLFSSFTNYDQRSLFTGAFDFVGLDQYRRIFTDPDFWWSTLLTVLFTAAMVAGSIAIGMAVAQLVSRVSTVIRHAMTIVLILAWAMPNVASSLVWKWLFQPGYGIVNWFLTQLHVFGDMTYVDWSASPGLAFVTIWLLIVWQAVPFIALTLYAAQTQIPPDYLEAARLDGAGEWRTYFSVVFQELKPSLLLLTVLSIIWDFNVFNQIWLLTQGGPDNATGTLGIWTYKAAFVSFNIGEGAAISVVTTIFLMIVTGFYIRNLVKSGEDL
ncbi:sugar ABC transporter permease [soil metagenome]